MDDTYFLSLIHIYFDKGGDNEKLDLTKEEDE